MDKAEQSTATGEQTQQTREFKQVCVIHILFPMDSDEQALKVNAAITEAVKDIKGVRREMRISSGLTSEPRSMP